MTLVVERPAPTGSATTPARGPGSPADRPLAVAVAASDELFADAARAYLAGRPEVVAASGEVDVVLAVAEEVDESLCDRIDGLFVRLPDESVPHLVLLVDRISQRQLWWAVARGLLTLLPRATTSWDDLIDAMVAGRHGHAELPPEAVACLLAQVRATDAVIRDAGLCRAGLSDRERQVLRLYAAGLETVDVARELHFSERTIKATMFDLRRRLGLRNRAQAIAYAVRHGSI